MVILRTPGHTPRHSALLVRLKEKGPVRLSGDLAHVHENYEKRNPGDVAKAEAFVEATGGIFGPHAETKAKSAASGLTDQRPHELLANALAARIRVPPDRHLGSLLVPVGELELFGGKAPCPGCTDDFAVLFGDDPEIPRSPPPDEIFGYARNRLRRLCIGFRGRHREEIPQYLEVIRDSRTDHKIGHRNVRMRPYPVYSPLPPAWRWAKLRVSRCWVKAP